MAVSWLINGGDPNHLLTGMILQVHMMQALWVNEALRSRGDMEQLQNAKYHHY